MWSGPKNDRFLSSDEFVTIVDNAEKGSEVQIGGGEPTLHPKLIEFVEYCCAALQIDKIIIDTNGVELDSLLPTLFELAQKYDKPMILKISVNYFLLQQNPKYLQMLQKWSKKYPISTTWTICLSIRLRTPQIVDNEWLNVLYDANFYGFEHNLHTIEYTGRAKQNKVQGTVLTHDIRPHTCNPLVYACDGTYFGADFDARMDYENTLSNDQ